MSCSIFDFIVYIYIKCLVVLFVHLLTCQFGVVWIIQIMNVGFSSFVFCLVVFEIITLHAEHSILNEEYAFSCSMCD